MTPQEPGRERLALVKAAIPLEALHADNLAGSQLIAPSLREHITEAVMAIRAALAVPAAPESYRAAMSAMQDDMQELLGALGLPQCARDASPHEVMVNEIIPAVRALRGAASVPREPSEAAIQAARDCLVTFHFDGPPSEVARAWRGHPELGELRDALRAAYVVDHVAAPSCPHVRTSPGGTSYCTLAEQGAPPSGPWHVLAAAASDLVDEWNASEGELAVSTVARLSRALNRLAASPSRPTETQEENYT
jgi:hypothetical protein